MEQFSTHTQTHTLIHRRGFSSALRGDRVVCFVLIAAIQPIQHGERARETQREREVSRRSLLSTRFWILEKKKKTSSTWK